MDEQTLRGAKEFEEWMAEEEERMRRSGDAPVEFSRPGRTRLPMFRERPKFDRQLTLF
jgi:hypothetical protein